MASHSNKWTYTNPSNFLYCSFPFSQAKASSSKCYGICGFGPTEKHLPGKIPLFLRVILLVLQYIGAHRQCTSCISITSILLFLYKFRHIVVNTKFLIIMITFLLSIIHIYRNQSKPKYQKYIKSYKSTTSHNINMYTWSSQNLCTLH